VTIIHTDVNFLDIPIWPSRPQVSRYCWLVITYTVTDYPGKQFNLKWLAIDRCPPISPDNLPSNWTGWILYSLPCHANMCIWEHIPFACRHAVRSYKKGKLLSW